MVVVLGLVFSLFLGLFLDLGVVVNAFVDFKMRTLVRLEFLNPRQCVFPELFTSLQYDQLLCVDCLLNCIQSTLKHSD